MAILATNAAQDRVCNRLVKRGTKTQTSVIRRAGKSRSAERSLQVKSSQKGVSVALPGVGIYGV